MCGECVSAVWASVLVKVLRWRLFVWWLFVLFVLCVVPVMRCDVVGHVDSSKYVKVEVAKGFCEFLVEKKSAN